MTADTLSQYETLREQRHYFSNSYIRRDTTNMCPSQSY